MNLKTMSEGRRKKYCFLLCMLCTFCTDVHLAVGMNLYEKIIPVTSAVQIFAAAAFVLLAVRKPVSRRAGWHLCMGIGLVCWMAIAKYCHALVGEPREYIGVMVSRFLVLLPFAGLLGDEEEARGLKGAGGMTLAVCAYLCLWSVLLFVGRIPEGLQKDIYWSGARMNTLWNPIIFAVILFMGIALCVAGCFLVKKKWQKAALLCFALVQFLFISMTHSRTVVLMICAFAAGTLLFAFGQGPIGKRIAWGAAGVALAAGLFWMSETVYNANNQRLIHQMQASGQEFQINDQGHITDGVTNQHSFKEDAGSFNGRTVTWKKVVDAVRGNQWLRLFGTSQFRKNIREDMAHSHNSWLEMLVAFGLPGLLFSVVLTVEILIALARIFLFCRERTRLVMALWVLCMLPIGVMEPFLFRTNHLGDLFVLTSGYLWAWGRRE